jgi:MFS family permease
MTRQSLDRSYRALLALPSFGRLLAGMQIARIGQAMMSVTFVLFALETYHSPSLAGIATFCVIFPGLVVSPIAGALLDRHGRTRLVVLDYLVALASLTLIGVLGFAGMLPAWLLMVIASVASLTTPLSGTGLRSLFPLIVPSHLWERVNALDSLGYVLATVIGPPIAAVLVALSGGPMALVIIGLSFGLSAIVISGAPDPPAATSVPKPLLVEAWEGVVYAWRNPTIRALGFSISIVNLINGTITIVVPLIVLQRLHLRETAVGFVFAVQGLAGIVSAIMFGRVDSRDRERLMLALPMMLSGFAAAILLLDTSLGMLMLVMALLGFLNGPLDVALFTLRQRRTPVAWTGRAFAVSMSVNYIGIPIGSAIAGIVGAHSIEAAIACGVLACLIAGVLAWVMIPVTDLDHAAG